MVAFVSATLASLNVNETINPFHDLYLTEAIGPDRFVRLFSPNFVSHALALFQSGNVVLRGLQGSGKTMLLNLLKPEIRIAYDEARVSFPVPGNLSRFVAAGINLRKSGVMDFGHLALVARSEKAIHELALHFGDFLNYWIAADVLHTLELLSKQGSRSLSEQIGLRFSEDAGNNFARAIANDPCWFGYLQGVKTWAELKERIAKRIVTYRRYVNLNLEDDRLPDEVMATKTVVGLPVTRIADALWGARILAPDTKVLIRIDQYEQLPSLDSPGCAFGTLCQEVTHRLLAARDARVSYRLGTRQYAWPDAPKIFGTNDRLENRRDYSILDIDEKLRRKENSRTWIFPEFASDIFRRRITQSTYAGKDALERALDAVFGNGLSATERAKLYQPTEKARLGSLRLESGLPTRWQTFVRELAISDPLNAKFADAWVRQKSKLKRDLIESPPMDGIYPWDQKRYWRKERTEQALMQIASANNQQAIWCGKDDIIGLSGGNILVFLFLCQHVWDAWLRDERHKSQSASVPLPRINSAVQSQGIREASEEWISKLREGQDSDRRSRFLRTLGQHFYRNLTDDLAMSYPGRNGFSVNLEELAAAPDVHAFLRTCVEYGDLYDAPHTSKYKGEARLKYYLAPIFCPYFRIPYAHTKEPEYVGVSVVREWIGGSARPSARGEAAKHSPQFGLFGDAEKN